MSKNNSEIIWIEAGYNQFAVEGLEGIQVERLAKITGLNKSGYYHYFGNQETYLEKLMEYHLQFAVPFTNELRAIKQFDPEYMELLIRHSTKLMFTNQIIKNRHLPIMVSTLEAVNKIIDPVLSDLFADFIGFKDYAEFSVRYFNQVRYMFHARITPEQMNYEYLRDFMYQAREVAQQAVAIGAKTKS